MDEYREALQALLADEDKLASVSEEEFNKADTDGSGRLSKAELTPALQALYGIFQPAPLSEQEINMAFEALDTSGDGRIDSKEFFQLVKIYFTNLLKST